MIDTTIHLREDYGVLRSGEDGAFQAVVLEDRSGMKPSALSIYVTAAGAGAARRLAEALHKAATAVEASSRGALSRAPQGENQ